MKFIKKITTLIQNNFDCFHPSIDWFCEFPRSNSIATYEEHVTEGKYSSILTRVLRSEYSQSSMYQVDEIGFQHDFSK